MFIHGYSLSGQEGFLLPCYEGRCTSRHNIQTINMLLLTFTAHTVVLQFGNHSCRSAGATIAEHCCRLRLKPKKTFTGSWLAANWAKLASANGFAHLLMGSSRYGMTWRYTCTSSVHVQDITAAYIAHHDPVLNVSLNKDQQLPMMAAAIMTGSLAMLLPCSRCLCAACVHVCWCYGSAFTESHIWAHMHANLECKLPVVQALNRDVAEVNELLPEQDRLELLDMVQSSATRQNKRHE